MLSQSSFNNVPEDLPPGVFNAPACFGAASVFAHDSLVCRSCHAFDNCSASSYQTLQRIRDTINVSDLLKRHDHARGRSGRHPVIDSTLPLRPSNGSLQNAPVERETRIEFMTFQPSKNDQAIIESLPVKPAQLAESFCKRGIIERMRNDLPVGRNPFDDMKPPFMRVVCDLLLAGGFTKIELREAFQKRMEWTESTSRSHVSIVISVLLAFEIITVRDTKHVIKGQ